MKTLTATSHPDNDTLQEIAKFVTLLAFVSKEVKYLWPNISNVALVCRSVSSCLSVSQAARSLIFEGIRLRLRDVRYLSKVRFVLLCLCIIMAP